MSSSTSQGVSLSRRLVPDSTPSPFIQNSLNMADAIFRALAGPPRVSLPQADGGWCGGCINPDDIHSPDCPLSAESVLAELDANEGAR